MTKFLALALLALPLAGASAHAQKRLPKPVCGGKLVIENVDVKLNKKWPPEYTYVADITNKSTAPVHYDLRFTGWKSSVKVILVKTALNVTIAPGRSDRYELGHTTMPNGNEPGLNEKEIEDAIQVTCK